ncbi:AraC family transcriptional regulator [Pseudomonas aeruginosa]|uniref:GlxA family transcriptional regulator n=1 Tax=Pseudomonas aeruginosa TaxID=287 RepID=UPI000A342BF6|nr:GlxA family transcriptional regulator [Pseudomonas aeruginosa]OTJ57711.1 AraC family transcriptional regulator [Pseudomonas aeruginosa]
MERRRFSAALQGQNLRFTGAGEGGSARARVGFLLLEHFSLPAFTQALDTLVTANLIRSESFAVSNFSLSGEPVTSDLGLLICPDLALASAARQGLDLLVVCGGLRTPLRSSAALREALQDVASRGVAEIARNSQVTSDSYMVDRDRLTAASPTGAFNLALEWIARRHGRDLVEAVVDILAFEESRYRRVRPALHEKMSEPLREVINLMAANIEEPLSQEQFAHYVGRSRRQIERLFQQQLGTTPVRYYLELRITECRRLLQHSDLTMLEVLVACGFVSPSHFSKCYTAFYGYPPSKEVRYGNVRSTK